MSSTNEIAFRGQTNCVVMLVRWRRDARSVFEDEVSRERGVVVQQAGIFAELNPDEVVDLHRQHYRLSTRAVTGSPVTVYRYLPTPEDMSRIN